MLTSEQAEKIKEQITGQIESWQIEEDRKESTKNYITSLNEEQLEEFLVKNNLMKTEKKDESKCLFCSIINNYIPSYKIMENQDAIAVLDIKPISRGHVLVIPKKHIEVQELPFEVFKVSAKIAKKLKQTLNPKEVAMNSSLLFGHAVINVVPLYGNETGERKQADEKELFELRKLLEIKESEEERVEEKTAKSEEKPYKMPRRIP